MTTNPTPLRGEVWRIRFDPAEGDEIKKVRTAVVISEDAVGRLRLKIVVPITEWKPRYANYPWFVKLAPTPTNGLTKDFRPSCLLPVSPVYSWLQKPKTDKLGLRCRCPTVLCTVWHPPGAPSLKVSSSRRSWFSQPEH